MLINYRAGDARAVAFDALSQILRHRLSFDEALQLDRIAELRDRAFAHALTAATLRRKGQIDDILTRCLTRPPPPLIEDLLRLGAAQLLFLGVPAHAVINEAVEFTKLLGLKPLGKLVNAVLRRVATEGPGWIAEQDAARLNTPTWLWQSWCDEYGEAATRRIAAAHQTEPPLDLSAAGDLDEWGRRLEAELMFNGTLRRAAGGAIAALPGFGDGQWWVQDLAASLPAALLEAGPGDKILDLCAAPGGKTAQLALSGAAVTALDRSGKRLKRLTENLARLDLEVTSITADAAEWRAPFLFDKVLLDAPCSATGTIRRHPDVAWNKRPEDIVKLTASQDRLLAASAAMVRPGGWLVYCTCSLQPEEGAARIDAFLALHPNFHRRPITASSLGFHQELLTADGDLRSLPCHLAEQGGMDGFFAARLEKDPS
jgi:16S rRNA (cytosine967-C5)-methyltransferase